MLFLPSSLLALLSIPVKHKQMGIGVIFRNIGVNLAFRLQKYMQNTINANMIHISYIYLGSTVSGAPSLIETSLASDLDGLLEILI